MIQIIIGSTLGCAEYVGDHLSDLLAKEGIKSTIHDQPVLSDIPTQGIWLIITSTHGAGDFPDNIQPFISELKTNPPRTNQLKYAVISIGDSSYDTFCQAGKDAFALLQDIGATPLVDCFTIDVLAHSIPEDAASLWFDENKAIFFNH
jgi:MioC protein